MPDDRLSPLQIIAFALGGVLLILAFGQLLRWVIPVIGSTIATTERIIVGGAAVTAFAPWIVWTGVTLFVATGFTTAVTLVVKGADKARMNPYPWTTAILAFVQPFTLDFVKEFSPGENYARLGFKALAFAIFMIGIVLWEQRGAVPKICGIFFLLLSPLWVIARILFLNWDQGLRAAVYATPPLTWIVLAVMLFTSLLALLLKYKLK